MWWLPVAFRMKSKLFLPEALWKVPHHLLPNYFWTFCLLLFSVGILCFQKAIPLTSSHDALFIIFSYHLYHFWSVLLASFFYRYLNLSHHLLKKSFLKSILAVSSAHLSICILLCQWWVVRGNEIKGRLSQGEEGFLERVHKVGP